MAKKNYKAFIVEGAVREPKIIENIMDIHFKGSNFKVMTLPAGQNIYVLWKRLYRDDFETDIIEVLRESSKEIKKTLEGLSREDFSEVFLFFDYDGQQHNLKIDECLDADSIISQMLQSFDNETENGKLYISYPMVEALRDFTPDICGNKTDCFWDIGDVSQEGYRAVSAKRSSSPAFDNLTFQDWKNVINVFAMRISCLMGETERVLSYQEYDEKVMPEAVFEAQKTHIQKGEVFILSAFPEFLLDYFQEKFWNSCLVHTKLKKAIL